MGTRKSFLKFVRNNEILVLQLHLQLLCCFRSFWSFAPFPAAAPFILILQSKLPGNIAPIQLICSSSAVRF